MKKKTWGKRLLLISAAVFFLTILIGTIVYGLDNLTVTMHLVGEPEIQLEYGETFTDPGARLTGSFFGTEEISLENTVEVQGEVRTDQLGEYVLTYRGEKWGKTAAAQRIVRVVDTVPPVITLKPGQSQLEPGMHYVEDGYTAQDNVDGDITDKVSIVELQEEILYSVSDSSGNFVTASRVLPGYDPIPPRITLAGEKDMVIPAGFVFTDPGFTAEDNMDGDLTQEVSVEGDVIWYEPGVYPVTYRVTDHYHNTTEVVRNVTVEGQPREETVMPDGKVIYLTFDDGPGPYTDQLLDVLARYDVKATFFVVGTGHQAQMERIVSEGHSIGIHSLTHNYHQIYQSPEAYFGDICGMQDVILENTGVKSTLMRFPGGSSNMVSSFNEGIMSLLTEAVQDAGFQYFDWNVDSNDAGGARTSKEVLENVIDGVQHHRVSVVLQHDIQPFSVAAVEEIIQWGQANGYRFLPLEKTSFSAHHGVNN